MKRGLEYRYSRETIRSHKKMARSAEKIKQNSPSVLSERSQRSEYRGVPFFTTERPSALANAIVYDTNTPDQFPQRTIFVRGTLMAVSRCVCSLETDAQRRVWGLFWICPWCISIMAIPLRSTRPLLMLAVLVLPTASETRGYWPSSLVISQG